MVGNDFAINILQIFWKRCSFRKSFYKYGKQGWRFWGITVTIYYGKIKVRAINGDANVSGHEKVEDPLNPGRGNRSRNNSWSSPEKNSSCSSQWGNNSWPFPGWNNSNP